MQLNISIKGYLVGHIWMPNAECYKHLSYDITRENKRFSEPLTLREHVLHATNDGDFQSCAIADGVLVVTAMLPKKSGYAKRTRSFSLDRFPSIADCIKTDWDGPALDE